MEFRVLGDLEVSHNGLPVSLGAHQQRALLAILILHAGEVVSAERLIDELWGERPPARAAKAVHVHVSRLRQALAVDQDAEAEELILTRDHGYLLRVAAEQIDARRFERLLDDGRRARDEGRFERAVGVLAEALDLWRGPALSEFAFDAFAAGEIARLDELRLEATEARIDAELALGRHAAVVAELDLLTGEHPLREHFQRQRMLALYRSGRQPDALEVYTHARGALINELGIEPSPAMRDLHAAILQQDPALDAPPMVRPPPEPDGDGPDARRRGRRRGLAVLAGLGAGALAIVVALLTPGGRSPVAVAANSVAVIDPARNAVVRDVAVGVRPGDIAVGDGRIWVANLDDNSLSEINVRTQEVMRNVFTGSGVDGLAAGGHALWAVDHRLAEATRLDPSFGNSLGSVHLGARPLSAGGPPSPIAIWGTSVWASTGGGTIARISARSDRVTSDVAVGNEPSAITVGDGDIWVADDVDDTLSRIDQAGFRAPPIPVGRDPSGLAAGAGAIWVANTGDDTVTRIDPATGATQANVPVGAGPRGIAVGLGSVWVADSRDGTVSRIDPRRDRVSETIRVGGSPEDIAIAGGRVWATVQAAAEPPGRPRAGGVLRIVQPADFGPTDPAVNTTYGEPADQLAYATCARLLDYPDRPAPAGSRLVPEVAARLPTVSDRGRTYTFTVRSGFRFSPPSGRPVTARAFERAIERSLSPVTNGDPSEWESTVGLAAYRAGRSRHIAGVTAHGATLTIRLTRRDPALPAKVAERAFCAVPPDTPIRSDGVPSIPSAGPYYIHSYTSSELVLWRNPNYGGTRPRHFDSIVYRFGASPAQAIAQVEHGGADYADSALRDLHYASGVSPTVDARLARKYGRLSPAARAGGQRYFVSRTLGTSYFLLNARRPLFAGVRMRRAVNFAVDRGALARYAQPGFPSVPTDQYLPPTMPGFRDAEIYSLGAPDVARARKLAGAGRHHAVLYTCAAPPCLRAAEILEENLRAIGISVHVDSFPYPLLWKREAAPHARYDIGLLGWQATYVDPTTFIDPTTPGFGLDFPGALARRFRGRIAAASRLSGARRLRAYGRLDIALATRVAPDIPFATAAASDFFSARIGCQIFQPVYGMDLAALCRRQRPHPLP